MPGIAGIIGFGRPEAKAFAISQMVKCMLHEPFYTSGTYVNAEIGICVGWINHTGSFSDCMPVCNEERNVFLIFSGEDFTDSSEIRRLKQKGHQFEEDNATYLVHLYEELGLKFIEKLNGIFSGLIIDLREQRIVLFNDRYGLDRIYFYEGEGEFYFASEAKVLLKIIPSLRQLDMAALGEFFSCGCALQNKSIFSKVSMVPGASIWTFSPKSKVQKESYFERETWERQVPIIATEYYDELKETWARILPRYFRGKERIAMSLTGGVDGRAIMAWIDQPPGILPTYTFGGMYRDCIDVKIARTVAKICKQPHQIIPINNEFFSLFPALAEKTVYITDGAMDVSASVDLYVNRAARDIAPVRMTGNYGQEILRSAVAFGPRPMLEELFDHGFSKLVRAAAQTYSSELTERRLSFVAFKQVPWHHYSRLALESSQLSLRSPYLDNDLVALAFRVPADFATSNELSLRLISDGNIELGKIATDRGILYKPIPVITKLRHLNHEFSFKAEYAYDYGMPNWLTKIDRTFKPLHLEKLFLGRHKFYHFRLWYREKLSRYIREVLLDARTLSRPYLNGRYIEELVRSHTEGWRNNTLEIHRILTVELLQRLLIEMK